MTGYINHSYLKEGKAGFVSCNEQKKSSTHIREERGLFGI